MGSHVGMIEHTLGELLAQRSDGLALGMGLDRLLVAVFPESRRSPVSVLWLDLDAPEDPLHGQSVGAWRIDRLYRPPPRPGWLTQYPRRCREKTHGFSQFPHCRRTREKSGDENHRLGGFPGGPLGCYGLKPPMLMLPRGVCPTCCLNWKSDILTL